MDDSGPLRLLLADDHPVVREGLAAILSRQDDMEVVAQAGDGDQAIELFRRVRPDLAILDLRMPGVSGVEAIARLRREFPAARLLVLTTFDGDADVRRALQAGADGYLLKQMSAAELVAAVRAAAAGRRVVAPAAAQQLAEHVGEPALTRRELEVLELIVAGRSNKRIARQLGLTEGTVKSHVNSILVKMGADDRTQAATDALRRGLVVPR
jgi:two-component system NarL family response regulator